MQRKVFVGISLPDDVKKRLIQKTEKWREFPVFWSEKENFHVTLAFLGYIDDLAIGDVCRKVKEAAEEMEGFDILFEKIELSPQSDDPKMVWLSGNASEELRDLQKEIEKSLGMFVVDKKEFRPHVTLGKIDRAKWRNLSEKPDLEENLKISIPVLSVEVFESRMEKGRRKYDVLENCELK